MTFYYFMNFLKCWRDDNRKVEDSMVNVAQFSPILTRSRAKNAALASSSNGFQANELPPPPKKSRNSKRGKNSVKKGKAPTVKIQITPAENVPYSDRMSPNASLTCPQTPDLDTSVFEVLPSPVGNLHFVYSGPSRVQSPCLGTISANTPNRNEEFHREIVNIADSRHRILGKGSFGTIIQATYKGELVAAKIVPSSKSSSLKNELNNFLLSHPNIVQTLRVINYESPAYGLVIMEMCPSFNLEHLIDDESYIINEELIASFMTDIAQALSYCHNQRILHLDVKPQNILVNMSTNICKLCDFGSSCILEGEDSESQNTIATTPMANQGTVLYMAPEILSGQNPTEKSDVYSFGITLWQIIHRKKPYVVDKKIDLQPIIYKIVKEKYRPSKMRHKRLKEGKLDSLCAPCWDHEPTKRPNIDEIIVFLQKIV